MGFKIGLLGLGTVGTGVGEIFANPKDRPWDLFWLPLFLS